EGSCDLSGGDRFECGWLGIDEATCLRRGCSWNSSEPDTTFCFVKKYQVIPEGLCPIAPSEREECGYFGIKKLECLGRSCCWDESVKNTKWCFKTTQGTICALLHLPWLNWNLQVCL
ncbi:unnamed protein product, partial [Porites lobata]